MGVCVCVCSCWVYLLPKCFMVQFLNFGAWFYFRVANLDHWTIKIERICSWDGWKIVQFVFIVLLSFGFHCCVFYVTVFDNSFRLHCCFFSLNFLIRLLLHRKLFMFDPLSSSLIAKLLQTVLLLLLLLRLILLSFVSLSLNVYLFRSVQ